MNRVAIALLMLAACGKPKHLPECDAFEQTLDKVAKCKSLPPGADRKSIEASQKTLKGTFDMLDQAGGIEKAPQDMQDSLRNTCKTQNAAIVEAYQKLAPACLK
jgi:hypothetical protein